MNWRQKDVRATRTCAKKAPAWYGYRHQKDAMRHGADTKKMSVHRGIGTKMVRRRKTDYTYGVAMEGCPLLFLEVLYVQGSNKNSGSAEGRMAKIPHTGDRGSDVSIIAGINPFRSVHQLWLEKTGQAEPEETGSEYAYFGTLLESVVRKEFTRWTGITVRQKHMLLQSTLVLVCRSCGISVTLTLVRFVLRNGSKRLFKRKKLEAYLEEAYSI